MRRKLTSKYVDQLQCDTYRRLEVWDVTFPAFGIRVSSGGHKSWFCVVRMGKRSRRITLGRYPTMSLSEAREAARHAINKRHLPEKEIVPTLGEVVPQFIELYAKPKNRGWRETERLLNQKFGSLYPRPLDAIRRADVVRILDGMIAAGAPGRANHAMAALKKLLNWALNRGLIEVNPIAGMPAPTQPRARDRVLQDHEIHSVMEAARSEGYPFGTLYLLLLFTGQRRGEVSGMRWSEIDFKRRIWTIPAERAKNRTTHEIPLSTAVMETLTSVPRFLRGDFVLTTTGSLPISGFGRAKHRAEVAVGSNDWRVHDLRRTAASGMARLGIAPHVIEKVLNHKTGQISGVAAVYNRYGYEVEKRNALDRWAQELQRISGNSDTQAGPKTAADTVFDLASRGGGPGRQRAL